jgi:chemotaxis protein CheX
MGERAARSKPGEANMVDSDIPMQPAESYIAAVTVALGEMAGTLLSVRRILQGTLDLTPDQILIAVQLESATETMFFLLFPRATAWTLAQRVLGDSGIDLHDNLILDCLREIANVVAGQAKTLLAGTSHQMTFCLPTVVAGALPQAKLDVAREYLVIGFDRDAGEFLLGLAPHG